MLLLVEAFRRICRTSGLFLGDVQSSAVYEEVHVPAENQTYYVLHFITAPPAIFIKILCQAVCRGCWVVVLVAQLVKHGARNVMVQFIENTQADRPWLHCKVALCLDSVCQM